MRPSVRNKNSKKSVSLMAVSCAIFFVLPFASKKAFHQVTVRLTQGNFKESQARVDTQLALAVRCFQNAPGRQVRYPLDPIKHVFQVHQYLSEYLNETHHYAAGYGGPWIENWWIHEFREKLEHLDII